MARGHSICSRISIVQREAAQRAITYLPLFRKLIQSAKCLRDCLIGKIGLVLLHQPVACLGVVGFGDGVLQVGLLYGIERDDDAVDLGQRVVQVALCIGCRQFDFLEPR